MKRNPLAVAVLFLFVLCARDVSARQPEVLRVIRIESDTPNTFAFGASCAFETTLPEIPLRLRIIRGTKAELIRYGSEPYNARAGCVEYYSLIVRPDRDGEYLDLGFDLREGWLNGRSNGFFVVVAERDDRPRASKYEPDRLRLAADAPAGYFQWGIEVTVLAPEHIEVAAASGPEMAAEQGECAVVDIGRQSPAALQAEGAAVVRAVVASRVD